MMYRNRFLFGENFVCRRVARYECRIIGLSDYWIIGLLDCWIVGLLEYWSIGVRLGKIFVTGYGYRIVEVR